jgi:hypothetical protein
MQRRAWMGCWGSCRAAYVPRYNYQTTGITRASESLQAWGIERPKLALAIGAPVSGDSIPSGSRWQPSSCASCPRARQRQTFSRHMAVHLACIRTMHLATSHRTSGETMSPSGSAASKRPRRTLAPSSRVCGRLPGTRVTHSKLPSCPLTSGYTDPYPSIYRTPNLLDAQFVYSTP